jgi:hypothetical protein
VILLLLLLIASGYGARRAALDGWSRVVGFAPAHVQGALPATGPAPLTGRLVLILVDGLRSDDTSRLPTLEWLGRQGSRLRLTAPAPAFAGPLTATILTGAPPALHGFVLPSAHVLAVDSLPAAAARAHVTVGGAGPDTLGALVGPTLTIWSPVDSPAALLAQAQKLLGGSGPRLVVLQLDQFHRGLHGVQIAGPDSPGYLDLLGDLDATLVQILQQIDLKTTTVLVSGTMPTGPDGRHPPDGEVPLILAGSGIRPGKLGTGSLTDIAPTAAALLGAPTPLQNQGRPLTETMAAGERTADVIAQRWLEARKLFVDTELQTFGATDPAPDAPATLPEAGGYLAALDKRVSEARFAYWKRMLPGQAPYLGGAALVLLVYLGIVLFQRFGGPVFVGAIAYAAVFHLVFFLTGGRYSAALPGLESPGLSLLIQLALKIGAGMTAAGLVTGVLLARRGFKKSSYLTVVSLHLALTTAAAVALPVVIGLVFVLWSFPVQLAAPGLLVWFFLTALEVMVIGFGSPLWVAVTVIATRMTAHIWPVKETPPEPPAGGGAGAGPEARAGRSGRLIHIDTPRRTLRR